ncbi:MAG: ATP-binding protein, partial [Deltaproteobacteria bacterium]
MSQTEEEGYNNINIKNNNILKILPIFTDFDGKFKGRLSSVIPTRITNITENAPISAKYDCRIKVEYHKDIMSLLEEGMIIAIRNFKCKLNNTTTNISEANKNKPIDRFTLLVISRIWPDHYGLRGLSDSTYYPMQFEVIEQSVVDWDTDDKSTMMIQLSTIPINYDLIFHEDKSYDFVKGFSYPIIGDQVFLLNSETIRDMYNKKIIEQLENKLTKTKEDSTLKVTDQNIGIIKMFENSQQKIPIYVNYDNMIRFHFGIFSFTGGGKSNLLSNLLRKILLGSEDTKIVIFDISCEYPFLLMDIFNNPKIKSQIILESQAKSPDQFNISVVKPRDYEESNDVKIALSKIYEHGIVSHFVKPQDIIPTYKQIVDDLNELKGESVGKPHYLSAINEIYKTIIKYVSQNELDEKDFINLEFVDLMSREAVNIMKKYHVHDKSTLYGWGLSLQNLINNIKEYKEQENKDKGFTTDEIIDALNGDSRLICLSISEPYKIKELAINISREMLRKRKKQFKVRPYILFVFDEAQEFIPDLSNSKGMDKECSQEIETLLRQGRKYGLGGCIATQRIAYLNTSALQQLHTYFVGTLPRPYDRTVVSSTFAIDQGILEKTLE